MSNVILSIVARYSFDKIEPFLLSLKNVGYKDDLVLFIQNNPPETLIKIKQLFPNVKFINFENFGMRYSMLRHFLILSYLLNNQYDKVMITDSRDVLFQDEPFKYIKNNKLYCSLEDEVIGKCVHNSAWIKQVYGETILNSMYHQTIACAGVVLGGYNNMYDYLYKTNAQLEFFGYRNDYDQAIHNHIIFNDEIVMNLVNNKTGFLVTIGHTKKKDLLFENGKLINDNKIAIIHQYDRHEKLFKEKWRQ